MSTITPPPTEPPIIPICWGLRPAFLVVVFGTAVGTVEGVVFIVELVEVTEVVEAVVVDVLVVGIVVVCAANVVVATGVVVWATSEKYFLNKKSSN